MRVTGCMEKCCALRKSIRNRAELLSPRLHPPQCFWHNAVPREFSRVIGGQPQRTKRQLRHIRDLPNVELRNVITRPVIVSVLAIEKLHDGNAAFEIWPGIGARIIIRRTHVFVAPVERNERNSVDARCNADSMRVLNNFGPVT